ncbi:MAG: hypothetical protein GY771_01205 [bacterium]|nr:hypothetical protein [bacterium]
MTEFADKIRKAGILGAGGGGFPAFVKYSATADIFVVNGAECEPLLDKDRQILLNFSEMILSGIAAIQDAVGAKRAVLVVKQKNLTAMQNLYDGIELAALPDVYPMGDEAVLVYEVTGRRVPGGGIPLDVGVVVSNVETVYNAARARNDEPVLDKFVTVCGAVKKPATYKVPVGTPAAELLSLAKPLYPRYMLLDGGPMMGVAASRGEAAVSLYTSAFTVVPLDSRLAVIRRQSLRRVAALAAAACTQCRDCTELCPRYLLGHNCQPHLTMRRFAFYGDVKPDEAFANAAGCTECGLCELYACPMAISPRMVQKYAKDMLKETKGGDSSDEAHPDRRGRQIPTERLKTRLGLNEFPVPDVLYDLPESPRWCNISMEQPYGTGIIITVEEGDAVKRGQILAKEDGERSIPIYTGIDGRVTKITDKYIKIDRATSG